LSISTTASWFSSVLFRPVSSLIAVIGLVILAIVPLAPAKNKQVLPDYVLQAQTVAVVIQPDAGEPVTNPMANRTAEESVEKAF